MRRFLSLICVFVTAALPLWAQDLPMRPKPRPASLTMDNSAATQGAQSIGLRPKPRPAAAPAVPSALAAAPALGLRPKPRPAAIAALANPSTVAAPVGGMTKSPRPKQRPQALLASAAPAPTVPLIEPPKADQSSTPRRGSVCGDRAIRGEKIKPITSQVKGCGIAEPVRVTEVSGIRLSQAVTIECGTAQALKEWIDSAMRPAFGAREVVQLRIAAHYVCRGRNNKKGARVSEHGKGKALDIAGFVFADGTEWTIARDYNKQIRKAHQGACGIFGTTLGPGSDGYHENHLHFDTASYRSGPYCR